MVDESTVARYRDAALALLPPGKAFARELTSHLSNVCEAIAVEFARLDEEAVTLYRNITPVDDYLDEWEEALGLPAACVVTPPTTPSDRAAAARAKLIGRASHARSAFEGAAAALGFSGIEFVRFDQFVAGESGVGDQLADDGLMHVVRCIVPTDTQRTDEVLICTFTDQLRRAHAYFDMILEGPVGAARTSYTYFDGVSLGATTALTSVNAVPVRYGGHLSIQCVVAQADKTTAPTDAPAGVWKVYASTDGARFVEVTAAAVELGKIAPNGNNVVNAYAIFEGFPGTYAKIQYVRTSGGGTNAVAFVSVAV